MNFEDQSLNDPEWILEETLNGELFWRREPTEHRQTRVTFRHNVQVMEFEKEEHENDNYPGIGSQLIGISLSCVICVLVTAILPWYLVIGS